MKFHFEPFVAWRYLRGVQGQAEGRDFLRFITYVAVGGVAVGVAALLLSLAIVRGFSQEIQSKIIGFGSHIQVSSYLQDGALSDAPQLEEQLREYEQVEDVAAVVEKFVLLRRAATRIDGVALVGVDAPPAFMTGRIVQGAFQLEPEGTGPPGLVLGAQLAQRLDIEVGDTVTAFSLQQSAESGRAPVQPRLKQFRVTGIYEVALANIDDLYAFTGLRTARELVGMPTTHVTRFDLTVRRLNQIDSTAARIEREVGYPVTAQTVYERQRGLFAWINLQQNIIPLVIGVIVLVAAFNIIGILLMMILEKTREIGVLGSIGASGRQLRRLFLTLGALIGGVGITIGEVLALALGYLQIRFDIIPLPAESYYMSSAPVSLHPFDFVLVAIVTFVLCLASAYIPARVASRIEPVQAIRFE